jgi:hypothetical protein
MHDIIVQPHPFKATLRAYVDVLGIHQACPERPCLSTSAASEIENAYAMD